MMGILSFDVRFGTRETGYDQSIIKVCAMPVGRIGMESSFLTGLVVTVHPHLPDY